jgi:hypothetical protein
MHVCMYACTFVFTKVGSVMCVCPSENGSPLWLVKRHLPRSALPASQKDKVSKEQVFMRAAPQPLIHSLRPSSSRALDTSRF